MNNLLLEVIVWKNGDKTDVLVGIVLRKVKVEELLFKLLKKKVGLSWIGEINAGKISKYNTIASLYKMRF